MTKRLKKVSFEYPSQFYNNLRYTQFLELLFLHSIHVGPGSRCVLWPALLPHAGGRVLGLALNGKQQPSEGDVGAIQTPHK